MLGHREMSKDNRGFIYWRGRQIEHFDRDIENEQEKVNELARRCYALETHLIPVTSSTVVWYYSWFSDIGQSDRVYEQFLQWRDFIKNPRDLYVKEGVGIGYYIEKSYDDAECNGVGTFHYWTGSRWDDFEIAWNLGKDGVVFNMLDRMGWHTAQAGQGTHLGLCYATTEGVMKLLSDWSFPTYGFPTKESA